VVRYSVPERFTVIEIHITVWNTACPCNVDSFIHKINGNRLGRIEMMPNFDPVLKKHATAVP
jgi:hypothetical protein